MKKAPMQPEIPVRPEAKADQNVLEQPLVSAELNVSDEPEDLEKPEATEPLAG